MVSENCARRVRQSLRLDAFGLANANKAALKGAGEEVDGERV